MHAFQESPAVSMFSQDYRSENPILYIQHKGASIMPNEPVPDDEPEMSITPVPKYDFENVEAQPRDPPWRDLDVLSTKKMLEVTLSSGSFWNKMFVIACIIAVSLDPLFFYIPIINEEEKCLGIDKELRIVALILRSLTDVTFAVQIIYHICKAILASYNYSCWYVPKLEGMDGRVLKMMCDYLKPVMYDASTLVFQMGEPLHSMLFITEGTILTYKTTSNDSHVAAENVTSGISTCPSVGNLEKGDFYGAEELIKWASQKKVELAEVPLPFSAFNVKCHSKVEGFVLTAKDLKSVVSKCEHLWKLGINNIAVGGGQTTTNARNVQQKPGVNRQY